MVKDRAPDNPDMNQDDGMLACATDLCDAIHAKNYQAAADALRAAFELADSEPHAEGEHTNEEQE